VVQNKNLVNIYFRWRWCK